MTAGEVVCSRHDARGDTETRTNPIKIAADPSIHGRDIAPADWGAATNALANAVASNRKSVEDAIALVGFED